MSYSVAIPAYNSRETIADTVQSVLAQTVPPAQIVIVDDGSDDQTAEIAQAQSDMIEVIRQENTGCGKACSRAIRSTTCDIVATVDADDVWLPNKMEKQLVKLRESAAEALVFARHRQFQHGSDDFSSGELRPGMTRSDLVFRRDVFERVGDIIDPPGGRGDMVDWLGRARDAGCPFEIVDEVLVMRRIIPTSLSYGRDTEKDLGYLQVAYRALQRQRAREHS